MLRLINELVWVRSKIQGEKVSNEAIPDHLQSLEKATATNHSCSCSSCTGLGYVQSSKSTQENFQE